MQKHLDFIGEDNDVSIAYLYTILYRNLQTTIYENYYNIKIPKYANKIYNNKQLNNLISQNTLKFDIIESRNYMQEYIQNALILYELQIILSDIEFNLVMLYYFEGYKLKEIADRLDMSLDRLKYTLKGIKIYMIY